MSCETNRNSISKHGAIAAGLSTLASKTAYAYGATIKNIGVITQEGRAVFQQADNVAGQGAAIAAYMMGIAGSQHQEGGVKGFAKGTVLGGAKLALQIAAYRNPMMRLTGLAVNSASKISGVLGSNLAGLTKIGSAGQVMQEKQFLLFFKKQVPVALWKSNLTDKINRLDLVGSNLDKVVSSEGVMFKPGKGETWHRGTVVVKAANSKRSITHLQSLNIPQTHYYFNQAISDTDAVGIAAGKIKPQTVPGYAGSVTPLEALCPSWATTKQSLLKAYINYGAKA
jgi:hypothetical protein